MTARFNKVSLILIIIGLISIGILQVFIYYFEISDTIYGFLIGASLGLMILGLIKGKKKVNLNN